MIALVAAAFLIIVTITGLLLNHAAFFGLALRHPGPQFVASVYGIEASEIEVAYEAGNIVFVSTDNSLYADGRWLADSSGRLVGAVVNANSEIVAATTNEVLLTTPTGVLIERAVVVDSGSVIEKLGNKGEQVVAKTSSGYAAVDSHSMALSALKPQVSGQVTWSLPQKVDPQQADQIAETAAGRSITWERVLLDLHSGRILPVAGLLIVDLAGFCLLYLCFSGILIWVRTRRLR